MKLMPTLCLVVISVVAIAVSFARPALTRGQAESLEVNDPRPLAEAIKTIEAKYGWIVTYEDPYFQNESDLVDVTDTVRKSAAKGPTQRVLIPRGGRFAFTYERPSPESGAALIDALVAEYNASGYPGAFRVIQTAGALHVVPAAVQGDDGQLLRQTSILDVPVTLQAEKGRSALQAIEAVLTSVGMATNRRIGIGTVPLNLLRGAYMEESATADLARDVIARTLQATGARVSWQLYYTADLKKYVLNIHIVK